MYRSDTGQARLESAPQTGQANVLPELRKKVREKGAWRGYYGTKRNVGAKQRRSFRVFARSLTGTRSGDRSCLSHGSSLISWEGKLVGMSVRCRGDGLDWRAKRRGKW